MNIFIITEHNTGVSGTSSFILCVNKTLNEAKANIYGDFDWTRANEDFWITKPKENYNKDGVYWFEIHKETLR